MNKHIFSTIALIFILVLFGVVWFVMSLDSGDIDDICEIDGKILLRNNSLWTCGNYPNYTFEYELPDLSGYLPYQGANQDLNISNHSIIIDNSNLTAALQFKDGNYTSLVFQYLNELFFFAVSINGLRNVTAEEIYLNHNKVCNSTVCFSLQDLNKTYSGNTFNLTYNTWAYNQTYSGKTYNASYVPYTGATTNVDLGSRELLAIKFKAGSGGFGLDDSGSSYYTYIKQYYGTPYNSQDRTLYLHLGNADRTWWLGGNLFIDGNTYINGSYRPALNYEGLFNNATYTQTFNSTYNTWAYNQTYSGVTTSFYADNGTSINKYNFVNGILVSWD